MRGTTSREGWHDYKIRTGIEVFPALVVAEHVGSFVGEPVPSGLTELDVLLDGGPASRHKHLGDRSGRLGQVDPEFAIRLRCRGAHCLVYEFEERIGTMLVRAAKLGLDLQAHIETGLVTLRQVGAETRPRGGHRDT
jgi:circadian clock protein KaiC